MKLTRITCGLALGAMLLALAPQASAVVTVLQNDGFNVGDSASYQGGFVTGEMAGSRFVPPGPFPMKLTEVRFLFGDTAIQSTINLHIWDDSAGTDTPGVELFSSAYLVTGGSGTFSVIDLSADNIQVSGTFRVGIEFTADGLPSVARDTDGTVDGTKNFLNASGFGWASSTVFGLTGDWVIRATVDDMAGGTFSVGGNVSGLTGSLVLQNNGGDDLVVNADGPFAFATPLGDGAAYNVTVASGPVDQNCVVSFGSGTIAGANVTNIDVSCTNLATPPTELKIDGFVPGSAAGFQGGFAINEIAAVRLTPSQATQVMAVRFLFGGAAGLESVRLHIYDDAAGNDAPGVELFVGDYAVNASDQALQEIDLTTNSVFVANSFRVGIELLNAGLPSVARDDDGNINATRNFIFSGGSWAPSSSLGLTGDWIIRAVVQSPASGASEPAITSILDIGNDQGRQVRIEFGASAQDQIGATTPVLQYEAFRRIDVLPGTVNRLAGWEFVGSIPAHAESVYNMIVPTLADSTVSNGMHWSAFFVRAATSAPATFFDSVADSGYSVDNLAPAPPQNVIVVSELLSWDPATETDFAYYSVYSSASPTFDGSAVLLGQVSTNGFDATGASGDWLFVTATDFSGNEGDPGQVNRLTGIGGSPSFRKPLAVTPNPFNPATRVSFDLPQAGLVTLRVYDLRGREVDSLHEQVPMGAGPQGFDYVADLPSGVYVMRAWSGNWSDSIKFSVVK